MKIIILIILTYFLNLTVNGGQETIIINNIKLPRPLLYLRLLWCGKNIRKDLLYMVLNN